MEKQWMESLRERFADRETTPPLGLWEGIEAAMSRQGAPVAGMRPAKTRALWPKRAIAVAACLAVLAGVGWLVLRQDEKSRVQATGVAAGHGNIALAGNSSVPVKYNVAESHVEPGVRADAVQAPVLAEASVQAGDVAATTVDDRPGTQGSHAPAAGGKAVQEREESVVLRNKGRGGDVSGHDSGRLLAVADVDRHSGGGVSVGVYGAGINSFGGRQGMDEAPVLFSSARNESPFGKDMRLLSANAVSYSDVDKINVRHRQPIKFGASVRFRLADRWGVETGLNYSYHSADIASGDEKEGYDTDQKLHFVGIPAGVSYNIWHNDFLEVYASAGGAVEFCVSGKSHTDYISGGAVVGSSDESLRDKRPQWSVNASAGVQFNVNDIIGVYLEPGVSYYFDNGSDVATIYKDKPFNFNLNFGLRFTVK